MTQNEKLESTLIHFRKVEFNIKLKNAVFDHFDTDYFCKLVRFGPILLPYALIKTLKSHDKVTQNVE